MYPSNTPQIPNSNPFNYEETPQSRFNDIPQQPSLERLSQQAHEAYPQHVVNSYNADSAYQANVDASRSATYSQFEVEKPRELSLAEITSNIVAVRMAALKAESNPSPVAGNKSHYDLAA